MTIAARLLETRKKAGLTQLHLAQKANVSQGTIGNIESGVRTNPRELLAIAAALDVQPEWLKSGKPPRRIVNTHVSDGIEVGAATATEVKIHVGRIVGLKLSAGTGEIVYDFEEVEGSRSFEREWMRKEGLDARHCKMVEVDGDSMFPTLESGESILVNTRDRELRHNKVFALVTDDGLRVKRLIRRSDGQWEIHSDNPMKHLYPTEDFVAGKVAIWGRVRWHAGTL